MYEKNDLKKGWARFLKGQWAICVRTSFYYYDQDPSGFCFLGASKFTYERKNEKNSGRSSKMTLSCKWPIIALIWVKN